MIPLTLSKSSIGSFAACPYQFKLGYIDRTKPTNRYDFFEKGKNIHKIFENFYDTFFLSDIVNRDSAYLRDFFRKKINTLPNSALYPDQMKNFVEYNLHRLNKVGPKEFKPRYREIYLEEPEVGLRGIIDCIYYQNGEYWLIDYKTGQFSEAGFSDYRFGNAVYARLLKKCMDIDISRWGVYFPSVNKFWHEIPPKLSFTAMERKVLGTRVEVQKRLDEGLPFERNQGFACGSCSYFDICMRGVKGEPADPDQRAGYIKRPEMPV